MQHLQQQNQLLQIDGCHAVKPLLQIRDRFRMPAHAERIVDFQLALMDDDIARGWRYFYAKELWFRDNLPPPLINDVGRADFLHAYIRMLEGDLSARFVRDAPPGYRNYIDVGTLSIQRFGDHAIQVRDAVADEVTWNYLLEERRHMWYEAEANFNDWYREASFQCTLTPPLMYQENAPTTPERDLECELHADAKYWRAVHAASHTQVANGELFLASRKPEWTLRLMAQLATDFVFDQTLSSSKRLVFPQPGSANRRWAIVIEKRDDAPDFSFPPQLALFAHQPGKRWSAANVLFQHVEIFYRSMLPREPREIEMQLRWSLPRLQKLVALYDDILAGCDA